jgi:glycerol-3-phosphate dehydrogenase
MLDQVQPQATNVTDATSRLYVCYNTAQVQEHIQAGTGVWSIGTLANGASATLTITATVNATGSYAIQLLRAEADPAH